MLKALLPSVLAGLLALDGRGAAALSLSSPHAPATYQLSVLLATAASCTLLLFPVGVTAREARQSADAHLDDARQFIAQNKHNEALQSLELAVTADPANYMVRFKRAAMFLNMGRNQAALEDFDRILETKPDFDQALLQRAKIHLKECALDKAIADLESLQSRGGTAAEDVQAMITDAKETKESIDKAQEAAEAANNDAVIEAATRALSTCSQDYNLRIMRAQAHENKGELNYAVIDYKRAAKVRTNDISTLIHLAQLQIKLGESDDAVSSLKLCLQYDPEQKTCSKLFKKMKKLTKALQRAADAMSRNRHREALGEDNFDVDMKSDTGAMSLMNEMGITQGPTRIAMLNNICECYTQLKSTDRIIKWCTDAIELDPARIDSYCARGDAYLKKDELSAAKRDFSKADEIAGQQTPKCVREGMGKLQQLERQASRKDYYKILGVDRDASDSQIKKAYRSMAMKYHPDKFRGKQEEAQDKMAEINQAYEVLSDPELRKRFDAGDDPNDPHGGQQGGPHHGHPFGQHIVFQQGSPFDGFGGFGGGGGGGFEFHFG